jgi:hypothetical protein
MQTGLTQSSTLYIESAFDPAFSLKFSSRRAESAISKDLDYEYGVPKVLPLVGLAPTTERFLDRWPGGHAGAASSHRRDGPAPPVCLAGLVK